MAVKVTRCPHCQTSFRVREEQLSSAHGKVRCGSCLQVFKAADYFQDEGISNTQTHRQDTNSQPVESTSTASTVSSKDATPSNSAPSSDDSLVIHDDMDDDFGLIHDDMDTEEDDDDLQIFDDMDSGLVEDDPNVDFNIIAPEESYRPKKKSELELDTSIFDSSQPVSFFHDFNEDPDSEENRDDEGWASALLEDDPNDNRQSFEPIAETMLTAKREKDDFSGFTDDDIEEESIDLDELIFRSDISPTKPKRPVDNVAKLQAEPLSLANSSKRNIAWGWLGGITLLLIVAAVQVFYFKFDTWSRTPEWRPFYSQVCSYLSCTLPKVQNIHSMSTQHLVVQSHPKLKGALMVDTLLYNKADHIQPFPDLLLVFRDINERIISSRSFTPKQYLSGELAGQTDMMPKSHTHIALEIVDPGAEAVSYHVDLLANH